MPLAALRQAMTDHDHPRALELALEQWTLTRAPELARLVNALDARTRDRFDGPKARSKEAFQAAWLEIAEGPRDVFALGWLMANFSKMLAVDSDYWGMFSDGYVQRKYASLLERVSALESWPPDPRVARQMLVQVTKANFSVWDSDSAGAVYGPMLRRLVAQGDRSVLEELEALVESPKAKTDAVRSYLTDALPGWIRSLRDSTSVEASATRVEQVESLLLLLRGGRSNAREAAEASELLEQIREEPSDLELRAVYADVLQSHDDPRGEFIALQLGPSSTKSQKRARALQREHGEQWLGEHLSRVLTGIEFEGGFLTRAGLAQNSAATPDTWSLAARDPRLCTLRELRRGRGNHTHYSAFIASPMMRSLRAVDIWNWAQLDALADTSTVARIAEIECARVPRSKHLQLMCESESMSRLARLVCPVSEGQLRRTGREIDRSGILDRIDELVFVNDGVEPDHVREMARPWMDRLTRFEFRAYQGGFVLESESTEG